MRTYDEPEIRAGFRDVVESTEFRGATLTLVAEGAQRDATAAGTVSIMPPRIVLDEGPHEAWVLSSTVWELRAYVPLSAAASAEDAHEAIGDLTLALLDALHDDRTLGGRVTGIAPAGDAEQPQVYTSGDRRELRRSLAFTVRH